MKYSFDDRHYLVESATEADEEIPALDLIRSIFITLSASSLFQRARPKPVLVRFAFRTALRSHSA